MNDRNLDLAVPVSREQWDQIARSAMARGGPSAGFDWKGNEPDVIHVMVRDEDAPPMLRSQVSEESRYGTQEREVARFVYNDGRPYAELDRPPQPAEPVIDQQQEHQLERELESFVRGRWQDLMRDSGIHYVRGHVTPRE